MFVNTLTGRQLFLNDLSPFLKTEVALASLKSLRKPEFFNALFKCECIK